MKDRYPITEKTELIVEGESWLFNKTTNTVVPLQPAEYRILKIFLDNRGQSLKRDEIAEMYWKDKFDSEDDELVPKKNPKSLNTYFTNIRKKLRDAEAGLDERLVSQGRSTNSYKFNLPGIVGDQVNINNSTIRFFSENGLEETVFKYEKVEDGLVINVNFEPTHIRKNIPVYAGAYVLFPGLLQCTRDNALYFEAWSENNSLLKIQVEIKPEKKEWEHETFVFDLENKPHSYRVGFNEFNNPDTYGKIEEITFVITPMFFRDENQLIGQFHLRNIFIK